MAKVRLYGATSGYVDLKAPDVADDVTIELPNASGPFALESYVDAAIAGIPEIAGIGSNVVQTVKTDSFSTTSSSLTDITGFTVTITPTSSTSKVLVVVNMMLGASASGRLGFQLLRDSTEIGKSSGGVSDSTLTVVNASDSASFTFLDSPATTSATVYKVQMLADSVTGYVNRIGASDRRGISSITAIEVAA